MRSSKRALSRRRGLFGGEIALGFVFEDGEHVDALAGAEDVDLGLLAFRGGAAELHDGGHVDGLDELLEAHGGRVVHAGVGGADGGVETIGGHLVGALGLFRLLGGGGGGRSSSGLLGSSRAAAEAARRCRAAGLGRGCGDSRSFALSGEGSASGRSSPSMVNLRRSVTTKGLFCSGMVHTLSGEFRCKWVAAEAAGWQKGSETGMAVPPG